MIWVHIGLMLFGIMVGALWCRAVSKERRALRFEVAAELTGEEMLRHIEHLERTVALQPYHYEYGKGWRCDVEVHDRIIEIRSDRLSTLLVERQRIINQQSLLKEIS